MSSRAGGRRAGFGWALSSLPALLLAATVGWLGGGCDRGGTIALSLVSAPDSPVLDQVVRARLTLTDPLAVVEAERDPVGGLALDLDVAAGAAQGSLIFEGFDQDGELVAYGRSGALPIAAINAEVAVYVAAPMSLAAAPAALDPPRSEVGAAPLSFGAVVVGGRTGDGQASAAVEVYSVYQHDFVPVADLPAARVAPAVATGRFDRVYAFGGFDGEGAPTADLYSVDTRAGFIVVLPAAADELARAGAAMAALGGDTFAVTGAPAVRIDGVRGSVTPFADAPDLAGTATSAVVDGVVHAVFAGAGNGSGGAVVLSDGGFRDLPAPAPAGGTDSPLLRTGHAGVLLPDGSVVVVGGRVEAEAGAILPDVGMRIRPGADTVEPALVLASARAEAATAATERFVVVAGGVDETGAVLGDAEVFTADELDPVATLAMVVPRRGATAIPLSNGQILILGGVDESGAPVGTAELFTPSP
ncbi:hypothetical protein [Haliangium sp.]|uniref:hypothetical protein n=1 Tax=Haliangium sp. TaxID=2663208 RepID=UPI003D0F515C